MRWLGKLLDRLDCTADGKSRRTGKPAWPESWDMAHWIVENIGGDTFMVHVLACWLERHAATTRDTYAAAILGVLRSLRIASTRDMVDLPTEAGLTWQRQYRREPGRNGSARQPRTVNCSTAALNSLLGFCEGLGLRSTRWVTISPVPVIRGRHIDSDPVVLTQEQLVEFWTYASKRPRRQFLGLLLAALHGLRRAEVAGLRWRDMRIRRRGTKPAPAVLRVVGKGSKPRAVQIHPAVRGWLESERREHQGADYILADAAGAAPKPEQVSQWAKATFRWMGLPEAYVHALRATWATLSLETRHQPLQVAQSGGWKRMETMTSNYFKRRAVPLINPFAKAR